MHSQIVQKICIYVCIHTRLCGRVGKRENDKWDEMLKTGKSG